MRTYQRPLKVCSLIHCYTVQLCASTIWHVEVFASITRQHDVTSWWQVILIEMHTPRQAMILVSDTVSRWLSSAIPFKVKWIEIFRAIRCKNVLVATSECERFILIVKIWKRANVKRCTLIAHTIFLRKLYVQWKAFHCTEKQRKAM